MGLDVVRVPMSAVGRCAASLLCHTRRYMGIRASQMDVSRYALASLTRRKEKSAGCVSEKN
jgi:hypothetical protein